MVNLFQTNDAGPQQARYVKRLGRIGYSGAQIAKKCLELESDETPLNTTEINLDVLHGN